MNELFQEMISHPMASLILIVNLVIIESLLSIDNAAVLATMVKDLPKDERSKALRSGIIGAYLFRGIALFFASFLVRFWFLKPLGGLFLFYLFWDWWKEKQTGTKIDVSVDKQSNWLYRVTIRYLGNFWTTVALVEIMDMTYSVDNVFAAMAFSNNIIIIWTGVFIGILSMRFVAETFAKLMENYPFLETCAFIVIFILGLKLIFSAYCHFEPCNKFSIFMEGENACFASHGIPTSQVHSLILGDLVSSTLTLMIFFIPILISIIFNYTKKQQGNKNTG